MTKIDIFSGFLGAGKTTLIKKLISECYNGEKLVLIENEFGDIGIDGGFLKDSGIEITEMNSGCICCSLVGDFGEALKKVLAQFNPDRILIEPSGVGKLSDVIKATSVVLSDSVVLNSYTTVVDAIKCKMHLKNFGEFFVDQIKNAKTVVFSHTENISEDKLNAALEIVREQNENAVIVSTPVNMLDSETLLSAIENRENINSKIDELKNDIPCPVCGHQHEHHEHHHHHDGECCCGHHHEHEHHHHDHCDCEEHEHHHEHHHDGECCCGHNHDHDHEHDHQHHHHADDVFQSLGIETARKYSKEDLKNILNQLENTDIFGTILRAKGIVPCTCGKFIHFDYIPGQIDIRTGSPDVTGRICIIGSKINKDALNKLFGIGE